MSFLFPDLDGCCCYELDQVLDAHKVLDIMPVFGVYPDETSLGCCLARLYAVERYPD
ncbi:hypothetical protein HanIR_Chr13g0628051 [Helianthus annuus]|nr:hypothetical protein HanIR_Chr13g0628051 [Helianthus annuus]